MSTTGLGAIATSLAARFYDIMDAVKKRGLNIGRRTTGRSHHLDPHGDVEVLWSAPFRTDPQAEGTDRARRRQMRLIVCVRIVCIPRR